MQYLGDYKEDDTVQFKWSTNDGDGASITRSTDGTIYVYIDGATAESTAGITDVEDFDGITGIHHCRIELTNAFYVTGADYSVVLKAATIDGQTVNAVLAHFSIENRFMRGTDSAALASSWTSALATILANFSSTRIGYLDNLSAGAAALEATLTAIKGTTWSDETLKAIKEAVDAITGDATAANQTTIITALGVIQTDLDNPDQYKGKEHTKL